METALILLVAAELGAIVVCRVASDSGRRGLLVASRVVAVAVCVALLTLSAIANASS